MADEAQDPQDKAAAAFFKNIAEGKTEPEPTPTPTAAAPAPAATPAEPEPAPEDDEPKAPATGSPEAFFKNVAGNQPAPAAATTQKKQRPNVSQGVSDEDLIKSFGYDPAVIYKSPTYQLAKKHFGSGFSFMLAPQTQDDLRGKILRSPVGAVGQGILDTALGISQLGAHLVGEKDDRPYFDLVNQVSNENYLQNIHRKQDPGLLNKGARVLAPALVPGGAEEEGASVVGSMARSGAYGAALGATQPVYTDPNDPNSFVKQKAGQVVFGAGAGAAGAGGARLLTGSAGRLASYFKTPLPSDAAAELAARLDGAMKGDWGNLSDLQNVGDPRLAARARAANEAITNAGTDPAKIEQAVIKLQNFRTAAKANGLYDVVNKLAENAGEVPVTNTEKTLKNLLGDLPEEKWKDNPFLNDIKSLYANLQPKVAEAPEPPPEALGNVQAYAKWKAGAGQPTVTPAGNTFRRLQSLSSDLGDMIETGMGGKNGLIAPQNSRYLQQIKDAVDSDLMEFSQGANAPQGLRDAAKAADDYYRTNRAPFLDRAIAKSGTTDQADTIMNMFIRGGDHADLAQKFFNILTPKGRAAVQSQMMDKIIDESIPETEKNIIGPPRPGGPKIDPKAFLENLDRYKKAFGVFFKGMDEKQLIGVHNLMQHAARVQQGGFLQNTAAGLIALGGNAVGFPWQTDVIGAGIGSLTIKQLLKTDLGKRIAYAAVRPRPDMMAPEMAKIWGGLQYGVPYAARMLGIAAAKPQGPITVKPWSPPPGGFATGGTVEERLRRNTLESLRSPR